MRFAIAVCLLTAAAVVLLLNPEVKGRILRTRMRPDPAPIDLTRDPVGNMVHLPAQDLSGRTIPERDLLLFVVGDCYSCSAQAIAFDEISPPEDQLVVLVFQGSEAVVREHAKELGPKYFIIADTDWELYDSLNAIWLPRWYELDEKRNLRSTQQSRELLPEWAAGGIEK